MDPITTGAVERPHYQHPALLRPCGTVPWWVRAQPPFPSLASSPFFVKFKPLILFFLTIRPYSRFFLCPTLLLYSPQDILPAALVFFRLELSFYDTSLSSHFSPFMSSCLLNPFSKPHLFNLSFARPSCFPF